MRTLLIAGFGDVASRAVPLLRDHWRLLAIEPDPDQCQQARDLGVKPLIANLDCRASLTRLAGLADAVLYTAPPPRSGRHDPRLQGLISALAQTGRVPRHFVYISTSGVYGNRDGAWLDECAPPAPQTARAVRRLAAEQLLRRLARRWQVSVTILRAPGIYASDRLPLERIRAGSAVPAASENCFTNHIHADDLAAICARALSRTGGIRIYNACDDLPMPVADWFDLLADHFKLPRPPRLVQAELERVLSPLQLSFLRESRRLDNTRLKRELYPVLRFPDALRFLAGMR